MAMLTTPARSHSTPESAPKTIGTDRWTVVCRTPVRFIDWPAATHVRKANTNAKATRPRMTAQRAPKPRVSCTAAAKATTAASRYTVIADGRTTFGSLMGADAGVRVNVEVSPGSTLSPKPMTMAVATAR